jgi:hypothetical protein
MASSTASTRARSAAATAAAGEAAARASGTAVCGDDSAARMVIAGEREQRGEGEGAHGGAYRIVSAVA